MTKTIEKCRLLAYGTPDFASQGGVIEQLLDCLEECDMAPTHWGVDERKRKLFSRSEILSQVCENTFSEFEEVMLWRDEDLKYKNVMLGYGARPYIIFEIGEFLSNNCLDNCLKMFNKIVDVFKPDVATVVNLSYSTIPKEEMTDEDWLFNRMVKAAYLAPVDYYRVGFRGLAMRTYLGPHYINQFGEDFLKKIPGGVVVSPLPWGGIRCDLASDIFGGVLRDHVDSWQEAQAYLESSELMPTIISKPHSKIIRYKRSPNMTVGGVVPSD